MFSADHWRSMKDMTSRVLHTIAKRRNTTVRMWYWRMLILWTIMKDPSEWGKPSKSKSIIKSLKMLNFWPIWTSLSIVCWWGFIEEPRVMNSSQQLGISLVRIRNRHFSLVLLTFWVIIQLRRCWKIISFICSRTIFHAWLHSSIWIDSKILSINTYLVHDLYSIKIRFHLCPYWGWWFAEPD